MTLNPDQSVGLSSGFTEDWTIKIIGQLTCCFWQLKAWSKTGRCNINNVMAVV